MKKICLFLFVLLFLSIKSYPQDSRPKIGLVLSGGGAKGLAHIGVLKELEKLGIRPDLITGTSMGAIIGGLYASGYSAAELEKLVKQIDWEFLLTDLVHREKLSIQEKDEDGKYFLNLPVENFTIKLPKGVVSGQNLSILLRQLCLPVSDIDNFNELPIPFACFAVDIVTGEKIKLDKGSLPDALRASMSIPSIFTPIKTETNLLVDGGVTHNFPVEEIIKMGADVVIGVDVSTQLLKEEKLNSLFSIMDQTLAIQSNDYNVKQQNLCDILIMPDISNYGTASFNASDSLISKGYKATQQKLAELKKLKTRLAPYGKLKELTIPAAPGGFHIYKIKIDGRKNVSEKMILGKLNLQENKYYTVKELENSVLRLFASQHFERVDYSLETNKSGKNLILRVIEKNPAMIRLGLHYDQHSHASLRFNSTFRNLWIQGSKLSLNTLLGTDPEVSLKYLYLTGWKPDIGIEVEVNFSNFDTDVFSNEFYQEQSIGEADLDIYFAQASLIANLSRSMAIGAGIKYEYHKFDSFVLLEETIDNRIVTVQHKHNEEYGLFNYFAFLKADSFNKTIYPEKGLKFNSMLEVIPGLNRNFEFRILDGLDLNRTRKLRKFWRLKADYHHLFKISKKFTAGWRLRLGLTSTNEIPLLYNFLLGGSTKDRQGFIPFSGLRIAEFQAYNFFMSRLHLQYKIFNDTYLVFFGDLAQPTDDYSNLFTKRNVLKGYTIKIGYKTFIGPIEFSVMGKNNSPHLHSQISVGLNF